MRPIQHFSKEYLKHSKRIPPERIVEFLENFELLHQQKKSSQSRLISLKIPEPLLAAFKTKSQLKDTPYQTQIKILMKQWLEQ